jgi:subtilisin family serine protease
MDMRFPILQVALGILLSACAGLAGQPKDGVTYGGMSLVRQPADVTGQYFVVFKSAPGAAERALVTGNRATILYQYGIIPAFAVRVPDALSLNAIKSDLRVSYVEAVQVYYALGTQQDPEITDPPNDQSTPGNATQDILSAWIDQPDNGHLRFSIRVSDLSAVNPSTGDGLPVNGAWKVAFNLQNGGRTTADQYFVQMRKPESGPEVFSWGYVDANGINSEQSSVDAGAIQTSQGIITFLMTNSVFSGAPNQNGNPQPGDVLSGTFASSTQLIGASGTGLLAPIDQAPDTGSGRNFTLLTILPQFGLSALSLDFGTLQAGQTKTDTLTVTNNGSTPFTISSVSSNNPVFTVTPVSGSLNPSARMNFFVKFSPTGAGTQLGNITFTHTAQGSPAVVPVKGAVPSATQAEIRPWGIDTVRAPGAWGTTKGRTIKVAILDTGIDSLHYDLVDRYKGGYNFVAKNTHPWDGHGHGTHCAGIIGATLNSVGVVGVAPEVDIYALKVLSDAGTGTSADILAAVDWAVQNHMNIASMSLGGGLGITAPTGQAARVPVYSPTEELAYQNAYNAGLLIITAAGNDGEPVVMYPAAYQAPMAVGAIDQTLTLATFSDYGADLEIVAPGVDILSTFPRGTGRDSKVMQGTTKYDANVIEFSALTGSAGITRQAINCQKGLAPSDFPAQVAGNIALIQRGDSSFASKVQKAQDAGAVGAIIYNNVAGNFNGTLGTARDDARNRDWIPGVSLSLADGQALAALGAPTVTLINAVGDFIKESGTSMATPHVSGVAALTWAANPTLTNQQVRDILKQTARDLGVPGTDPQYGAGLADAAAAVRAAQAIAPATKGGTVSPATPSVAWQGGPYTAVTADPVLCTSLSCDHFLLTVNIPASYYTTYPNNSVRVHLAWKDTVDDFDLYVNDLAGNAVNSSTQGMTVFEDADLGQLTTGTYDVQVVAFATVNESYSGSASVGPPPADGARSARYKTGKYTFTQPKVLGGPDGLLFNVQDLEPRAAYDAAGNIYVAAIQGTPGGTDVWKSQDGGNTFAYLGQPDGGQAASATAGRTPGVGGGDEDIAIGSTGRVYVASLFGIEQPMTITMSSSTNGGATWVANPNSQNVPLDDRQWIAASGDKTVYLTFAQSGALLVGTSSIFCMKSTDGGLTFPQVTEVTKPELGVQAEFQGNIAIDPRNGNLYTVFIGHPGNYVYVARSTDGGNSFVLRLVKSGSQTESYANVFPIIAVDRGGNLHVVYSTGKSICLASSSDQGETWTQPVRVSNGIETKTALSPWIDAGDAGKVDIMWWATSAPSNLTGDAKWKVYFAQCLNALSKTPTISENAATGVFHTGPICVRGTACAAGTRDLAEYGSTTVYLDGKAMIVYPDDQQTANPLTYFVKQTGGTGVLSGAAATAPRLEAVREASKGAPDRYALEQNYPNPFNPVTQIRYSLPEDGHVRLTVHNILGQTVADLIGGDQPAGNYSVAFDASRLPSGVYYYHLTAGTFADVKRMVLLK